MGILEEKNTEIVLSENENLQLNLPQNAVDGLRETETAASEIKNQNFFKATFLGAKNIRALAENDLRLSKAMKDVLNFCFLIASAETVRKEEYDELTGRIIKFDEDINSQLEMQVKFKKAYEIMCARQEEQKKIQEKFDSLQEKNEKMKDELKTFKVVSFCAIAISVISILVSIIF